MWVWPVGYLLLRPICFSIYMLPLQQNICRPCTSCHCHVHGTQLFLSVEINDRKLIDSLLKKLYKHKNCIKCNFLQLNADKPEVMFSGPDIAGEKHFSAHYVLISPLITSEVDKMCSDLWQVVRTEKAWWLWRSGPSLLILVNPSLCYLKTMFETHLLKLVFLFNTFDLN